MTKAIGKTALVLAALGSLTVVAGWPETAYADIPDVLKSITVRGELPYIINAFERVALIVSDNGYKGLFCGIAILTVLGAGIMAVGRGFLRGSSLQLWMPAFGCLLVGVMVYHAFITKTTQLNITDETIGHKWKAVGGIPQGIGFLVGLTNYIESGLIDIIWTSGNVDGYREQAGGIGFQILNKAFKKKVDLSMIDPQNTTGKYTNASLEKYIEDCVLFEVGRPGSSINVNDLNNNTNLQAEFAKAANPAVFTVWYDSSNPAGTTVSCQDAWNNHLSPYLNNLTNTCQTVINFWDHRCAQADLGTQNFGATNGTPIVDVCRTKAVNLVNFLVGTGVNSAHLMKQYLLASEMEQVIREGTTDEVVETLGSKGKGAGLMGFAILLNEWMPVIKGVYYSIFLALLPFLLLLIPTPLCFRALAFAFGSFFFLGAWGICDAIVHSIAMDYAINCSREIASGQLGLKSMLMFETESAKAMAAFGGCRMMSLMMAGTMATTITKFGGSAFAHMIARSSTITSTRAAQGAAALTPDLGNPVMRASAQRAFSGAMPTQAWANHYSYVDRMTAETHKRFHSTEAGLQIAQRLGGGIAGVGGAAVASIRTGGAAGMQAVDGVVRKEAIDYVKALSGESANEVQAAMQAYRVKSQFSEAQAVQEGAQRLGLTDVQFIKAMKDMGVARPAGIIESYQDAKDHGYKGGLTDFIAMQAKLDSMSSFQQAKAITKFADQYYGGDASAFLQDRAEYQYGQLASLFDAVRKYGWTPERLAKLKGHFEGLSELVAFAIKNRLGDQAELTRMSGMVYNEISKFAIDQAHAEIGKWGDTSVQTDKLVGAIAKDPLGRQELSRQLAEKQFGVAPDQAGNWARYINAGGGHVRPADITGKTLQLASVFQPGKGISISVLDARSGQILTESHYAKKTATLTGKQVAEQFGVKGAPGGRGLYTIYSDPQSGQVVMISGEKGFRASVSNVVMREAADGRGFVVEKISPETGETVRRHIESGADTAVHDRRTETGWSGSFGGYNFISATREDLGGGMVKIDGVTREGQKVTLTGLTSKGSQRVISPIVKQGPQYQGALTMTLARDPSKKRESTVPDAVLHSGDDIHAAAFASQYGKDVSQFYKGNMTRDEIERFNRNISAGLGISGLGGRLGADMQKQGISMSEESSTRDVATDLAYRIISNDSLSDRQKRIALRHLSDTFIELAAERSNDMPKVSDMRDTVNTDIDSLSPDAREYSVADSPPSVSKQTGSATASDAGTIFTTASAEPKSIPGDRVAGPGLPEQAGAEGQTIRPAGAEADPGTVSQVESAGQVNRAMSAGETSAQAVKDIFTQGSLSTAVSSSVSTIASSPDGREQLTSQAPVSRDITSIEEANAVASWMRSEYGMNVRARNLVGTTARIGWRADEKGAARVSTAIYDGDKLLLQDPGAQRLRRTENAGKTGEGGPVSRSVDIAGGSEGAEAQASTAAFPGTRQTSSPPADGSKRMRSGNGTEVTTKPGDNSAEANSAQLGVQGLQGPGSPASGEGSATGTAPGRTGGKGKARAASATETDDLPTGDGIVARRTGNGAEPLTIANVPDEEEESKKKR